MLIKRTLFGEFNLERGAFTPLLGVIFFMALGMALIASPAMGDENEIIIGPGTESPKDNGFTSETVIGGFSTISPYITYCENQGYTWQNDRCYFPDGTSCNDKAFYEGKCGYDPDPGPIIGPGGENPAAVYCIQQGYNYQMKNGVGYCVFPDGSSCEEWAFYKGACRYNPKPEPVPNPPKPTPLTSIPTATYTCQEPAVDKQYTLLDYEPQVSPPSQIYYQGEYHYWKDFQNIFSANSPYLWISTEEGWAQKAICPVDGWMHEFMYLPQNGTVGVYVIDSEGKVLNYNLGTYEQGYKYAWFKPETSEATGTRIALITVDGVPSNAIFTEVKADWLACKSA